MEKERRGRDGLAAGRDGSAARQSEVANKKDVQKGTWHLGKTPLDGGPKCIHWPPLDGLIVAHILA